MAYRTSVSVNANKMTVNDLVLTSPRPPVSPPGAHGAPPTRGGSWHPPPPTRAIPSRPTPPRLVPAAGSPTAPGSPTTPIPGTALAPACLIRCAVTDTARPIRGRCPSRRASHSGRWPLVPPPEKLENRRRLAACILPAASNLTGARERESGRRAFCPCGAQGHFELVLRATRPIGAPLRATGPELAWPCVPQGQMHVVPVARKASTTMALCATGTVGCRCLSGLPGGCGTESVGVTTAWGFAWGEFAAMVPLGVM